MSYAQSNIDNKDALSTFRVQENMSYSRCESFLFRLLTFAVCFYSVISFSQPHPICSGQVFGASSSPPQISDCDRAYTWIPQSSLVRHLFLEPQFQIPPFRGIFDYEQTGIVQVPKLWISGKSILLSVKKRFQDLNQAI